jgi:hypothetical protein
MEEEKSKPNSRYAKSQLFVGVDALGRKLRLR